MTTNTKAGAAPDIFAGRYAGFWRRFFAAVIDLIAYAPCYWGIMQACGAQHSTLGNVIFAVFGIVTYAMFFASKLQASPGMYILKFHVCDEEGRRISFKRAAKWGVVSTIGVIICCAGIFYMDYRFNLDGILQILQGCNEENLKSEDCIAEIEGEIGIPYQTFAMMLGASVILALFLLTIWTLSVALARDKSGFHNLICHTRFLKGRP